MIVKRITLAVNGEMKGTKFIVKMDSVGSC